MSVRSIALWALAATACSAELAERPPARDPQSVASAEAPLPIVPKFEPDSLLASSDVSPRPDAGTPSKAKTAVYTCPMHPEVESTSPGSCPKCGMTLVPRKSSP